MGIKISIEGICETQEDVALMQKAVIAIGAALPKDNRELLERNRANQIIASGVQNAEAPAPAPTPAKVKKAVSVPAPEEESVEEEETGGEAPALKAPAKKAAKAPAAKAPTKGKAGAKKDEDGRPTIVSVREVLARLAKTEGGYDKAKALLNKYDAADIPSLDEGYYGNVIEDAEAEIAGGEDEDEGGDIFG